MRIAYLVNRYPAVSHSFIRREIRAIEALGHTVERFSIRACPNDLPDPEDRDEAARTQVVLAAGLPTLLGGLLATIARRPSGLMQAAALTFAMARLSGGKWIAHAAYLLEACWLSQALAGRCDHLHAHFGTNPAAVARLVGCLAGIPYSFTAHGPDEFDAPLTLDLPGKIADAAFVVAISAFGRSQLMRWSMPSEWRKIAVVRCSVDRSFLDHPAHPPTVAPSLCCVARLSAQKGLPLLIEACAALRDEGRQFVLTIVGDGELRKDIVQAIAAASLETHVILAGNCDSATVRSHIVDARALVLASFAEGLPVVIMEAFALGRPVIATRIAGIPELVDETCGRLIPAGSVAALIEAMRHMLDEPPENLEAMGDEGRRRVVSAHEAGANARLMVDAFEAARG